MFNDRTEAGEKLAERLAQMTLQDPVVLALPRGGVPVAAPVARRLKAPLDLLMVRKIGMPGAPEVAAGAVVEGGAPAFNDAMLRAMRLSEADFAGEIAEKRAEIAARQSRLRDGAEAVPVAGRDAIVVDDGIATGATVRAALNALRTRDPARILLAVPVAPPDTLAGLGALADEVICLHTPDPFRAVSLHYRHFDQTDDETVAALLKAARNGESP